MPPRQSVRCIGHTKAGRRCSRNTLRANECWQHLQSDKGLRIKESQIEGSGLGLYTTKPRRNNRKVAFYGENAYVRHGEHGGDYVFQGIMHPPTYVNPHRTTDSPGRFANSAKPGDGFSNNSRLTFNTRTHKANITANRNFARNATPRHPVEVFASYGANARREYWDQQ